MTYPNSRLGALPGEPPPTSDASLWDQGVAAIPFVIDAWNSLFGGEDVTVGCWDGYDNNAYLDPCPNTPNYDWVKRAVETAPDSGIRVLIGYLLGANSGKGPKKRSQLAEPFCLPFWVKAVLGGKGCVASTYPEAPEWFLRFVQVYGEPAEGDYPGASIVAAATSPEARTLFAIAAAAAALFFVPQMLGKGGRS